MVFAYCFTAPLQPLLINLPLDKMAAKLIPKGPIDKKRASV